jgi:HEPN domain-containing protein
MEEADEWLRKAEREKLYDVAAFLFHQAAEKALKAVYILKFKRLWKIHDLYELGQKVGASKDVLELCNNLNPHYIATRYPSEKKYPKDDAQESILQSERVVK